MPTSIPFDSSLVLGNLISDNQIADLQKVVDAEQPANTKQEQLNTLIQTKHKLDMTFQEMVNMNVDVDKMSDFAKSIQTVEEKLTQAAADYGEAVIKSREDVDKLQDAKEAGGTKIAEIPESPIDWNKSAMKQLQLSSDTMTADAQYLRNEDETDGSSAHAQAVATSASATINSIFGPKYSASVAASTKSAVLKQTSNHKIAGTLVITATCTHKMSDVFAPFVMDPEKAINAWNKLHPDELIDVTKKEDLKSAIEDGTGSKKNLSLLSGQTVGSSFIGMVHVLQVEKTDSSQRSDAVSAKAQSEMEWGGFFASGSGNFGVDGSFSDNIKNMLSTS